MQDRETAGRSSRARYERPRLDEFGQIHELTMDRTDDRTWRLTVEALEQVGGDGR